MYRYLIYLLQYIFNLQHWFKINISLSWKKMILKMGGVRKGKVCFFFLLLAQLFQSPIIFRDPEQTNHTQIE